MQLSQELKRNLLHHIIIIAGFLVLAIAYCHPILDGQQLYQGDIVQWKGWSQEIAEHREKYGEEPLWTNSMFSGMTAFNISTLYKTDVTRFINHNILGAIPAPANLIFILLVGMFVLLRGMGINIWLSAIGALAFAFSSNYLISLGAGHNGKIATMGFSTGLLGGIILAFRGRYWGGLVLATLFAGLTLMHNHVQIVYYALIMTAFIGGAFFIDAIRHKTLPQFGKAVGVLVVAAIIGLLPNIAKIWSVYTHGQETMRGGKSELTLKENKGGLDIDYAMRWSTRPDETLTLLVPYYLGGGTRESLSDDSKSSEVLQSLRLSAQQREQILNNMPLYSGDMPFTEGPVYFGASVILLFFLGLLLIRMPLKWAILLAVVLSFFMAWGRHFALFNEFLFYNLPLYNKFRTPSMALHIAGVLMPLLGLWGVHRLLNGKDTASLTKKLLYATGALLRVLAIIAIGGLTGDFSHSGDAQNFTRMFRLNPGNPQQSAILSQLTDALAADRKHLYLMDTLRSAVFVLLTAGLLWAFLKGRLKNKKILLAGLAIVLTADVWMVSKRYLNSEDFVTPREYEQAFQPTQADLAILQDKDPYYRVFNLTTNPFNDAITSYHHKSIGGYHPAKLQRYQDMIDYHIGLQHMPVLNMLNTKYFIVPGQNGQPRPQQNPGALGNAWFVSDIITVPNANREMQYLDKAYAITDLTSSKSIEVHGKTSNADTIGSFETAYIISPSNPGKRFTLDMTQRNLSLQEGQSVVIGSSDSADITIKDQGLAPLHLRLTLIQSFEPGREVVIDQRYEDYINGLQNITPAPGDNITLTSYKANELVFKSKSSGERFAVFSDIYYPKGWEVTIDGKDAEYIRVNYLLRGMKIPAGEHTIVWTFRPKSYFTGQKIALAGSILFVIVIIGGLYMAYRKHSIADEETTPE